MSAQLTNLDEVLLRQIHPSFLSGGRPASDRFRPQPSDAGRMSVDRSALATPSQSHFQYTSSGLASAAVFGVSVGEFAEESLSCYSDPLPATKSASANPAHAVVDFTPIPEDRWKLISKRLAAKATARGQLHP